MRRLLLTCVVAVVALAGAAAPAWAASSTEVIQGQVLRLVSVADWDAASSLSPGRPVRWNVTVSADAPDPGQVVLGVSAEGSAPLLVDVEMCLREWQQDACPGGAEVLRSAWEVPLDGVRSDLARIADTDVAYVRLSVMLPDGVHSGSTSIRFHASGASESVAVGPDGVLAATGSASAPWMLLVGAAPAVLGLALILWRGARGRGVRRSAVLVGAPELALAHEHHVVRDAAAAASEGKPS